MKPHFLYLPSHRRLGELLHALTASLPRHPSPSRAPVVGVLSWASRWARVPSWGVASSPLTAQRLHEVARGGVFFLYGRSTSSIPVVPCGGRVLPLTPHGLPQTGRACLRTLPHAHSSIQLGTPSAVPANWCRRVQFLRSSAQAPVGIIRFKEFGGFRNRGFLLGLCLDLAWLSFQTKSLSSFHSFLRFNTPI